MPKYRRKPIYFEAVQWWRHGDHHEVYLVPPRQGAKISQMTKFGWLGTPQDGHLISPGDWILTYADGQITSCNPRTFERLYEEVPSVFMKQVGA